ncbi:MAG TPA: DUF1800 domain-containing protein [Sphingomicrobium sp.]|jgi:uncharacterized protein (DUF1800 family)|nr:DUF1800 domain-containing protein [Sphingomicrobium sp.]
MLETAIALNRFGLGARPGDPPPANPKGWLAGQFSRFQPRPRALAQVPSRSAVIGQLADYLAEARTNGQARRKMQPASLTTGAAQQTDQQADPMRRYFRQAIREDYLLMNSARLNSALTTDNPFAERLVHFWSNHFAVSVDKLPVIGLAGLLEFEAIRPHLFGRFSDLLLAVEQHPAMLLYLDQVQSIGPNSEVGRLTAGRGGKQRGLNENLAREIMELHTLGVRTGYSQADVTEFARALTGWTVSGIARGPVARFIGGGDDGGFHFADGLHEPGDRVIMGKRYSEKGEAQAGAILLDLASSPATARHISTKLARHFAGDDPPKAIVDRLTAAYLASGGDLSALYRLLVESPECWAPGFLKFKTPWEWSVSALRAVSQSEIEPAIAAAMLKELGQPTWQPGSPAGWDDIAASWAAPQALMLRVEVAQRLADKAGSSLDARSLAEKALPGSLTDSTRTAIARSESPQEGLALLLVSPEFMRR